MGIDIDIDPTSAIFYTISFLLASQGLSIISNNPHLHIVAVSQNPIQMYMDLAYNISVIFLLSFALRKVSQIFSIKQNTYININSTNPSSSSSSSSSTSSTSSLFLDVGIMLGLQFYFYDVSTNMKAAIYTIFLLALYLRTISKYMLGILAKPIQILGQGLLYSVFLVLALKIELVTGYYRKQGADKGDQIRISTTKINSNSNFSAPNIKFPSM